MVLDRQLRGAAHHAHRSLRSDIVFVDPIVGAGEIAISDHRSSQPTYEELLRLAADCHVAGLMSGKAGVLHLHLGDGARGLSLLRRALDESELPARVFHPTHVNRNPRLFEEALAIAARGVTVDVTAFPVADGEDAYAAADAILLYLAAGAPPERLTCSSDGGGCIPTFDADGRVKAMDVGRPAALADTLATLLERGQDLERVLPMFTSNVASLLRLPKKGTIAVGADADLVSLDDAHRIRDVMARGAIPRPQRRARGQRNVRKTMSPAKTEGDKKRGFIVPIGGAEAKEGAANILRRFIEVSGGKSSRIVIIPTASKLDDTGRRYEKLFRQLGADEAKSSPSTRARTARSRSGSTTSRRRTASSSPAATSCASPPSSAARRSRRRSVARTCAGSRSAAPAPAPRSSAST